MRVGGATAVLGLGFRLALLVVLLTDSPFDDRFSYLIPCLCVADVTYPNRHNGMAVQNPPVAPLLEINLLPAFNNPAAAALVAYFNFT
jgi:hypothetical protein